MNVARCNKYQGRCDLCKAENGGYCTNNPEEEKEEYKFDEKRPCSSTIEMMMGMSIREYCGI